MTALDVRHFRRHRDQIVGHVAVEHLSALIVQTMLEQRRADALYDAAANLLVHQLRINDGAAIFHAPMLEKFYEAGVGVDFEIAALNAIGEREGPRTRHVMARHHQFRLKSGR
jgi:hypothetical protein